jgi:hypothetical protein
MGRRKNFTGQSFWARGYYVSTVGRDEETVRNYIKHQESEDKRIEQQNGTLDGCISLIILSQIPPAKPEA